MSFENPYSKGIRKIYHDIYSHKHPARVSNFLERLDDVKEKATDGVGIGEILSLTHNRLDEAQLSEIVNKLDPPRKYTWDYTLVDYGDYQGSNPVNECKRELEPILHYINSLSRSPISELRFPYNPSMGKMGPLKHKLLIHCGAGMGRTGTVLVGIICLREGVDWHNGLERVKQEHPFIGPEMSKHGYSVQKRALKELFPSY